jgi:triacylglycerol lipase
MMYIPPDFDLERSIELAHLVMQAYDQLGSFQEGAPWAPKGGYTLIKELVQEPEVPARARVHTQFEMESRIIRRSRQAKDRAYPIGFVARRGGDFFVAFRGTTTVLEWIRNLNVRLTDYPRADFGKVHDGFLETYALVRKTVLQALEDMTSTSRLFVTGHSLGAALGTLALPDVAENTRQRSLMLHTFGSPRVGDNQFCKSFNTLFANRSFRIVNTSDVVVSLPLPVPVFGIIGGYFTHTERPVDFTVQENDLERNHSMETYLSSLAAAKKAKTTLRSFFRWR